ncbi:MAG: hypothetical protein ACI4TH_02220, partial [Candidatus Ornithomonoglobus sp.]
VNGMVVATNAFGITVALSFATSVWNGEDFDIALKNSVYSGLKVGGTALVTSIISGQLVKAGLNSALVGSSEALVNIMGPKASAVIANSLRSSTNIYGAAAMKSAAKIFRSNFITGTASVIVLSSVDVANIFSGKISGAQLFKNLVNTTVTVAGGFAGFTAGAAIGSIVPGIGTAIGGLVGLAGSFVAGSAASKASKKVMDNFIEDDANMMVEILQKVFQRMAEDYLITKDEAENITDELQKVLTGKILKEMYASGDREVFAYNLMLDMFENEAKKRPLITLPSNDEFVSVLKNILEEYDDTSLVGINDDQNEL